MMDYEKFKEEVVSNIKVFLPEKYKDYEIKEHTVNKINVVKDAITLIPTDENKNEEYKVSPTFYFEDMYKTYEKSEDINAAMVQIATLIDKAFNDMGKVSGLNISFENAKDNIVFQLVNTEQNRERLKDIPSREFEDLSVIYRYVTDIGEGGVSTAVITNGLAEHLGFDENELFDLAMDNTRRIFEPSVRNMNDVICEMCLADGMPEEMLDVMFEMEMPDEKAMWVISNKRGINGAANMLYEDLLHELSEKIGSDLYILPSSLHEVIAVSVNMGSPEELAMMVQQVNSEQVSIEDRLSNEVYRYDDNLRKVTIATDIPNKRIDGVVAEEKTSYTPTNKSR